MNDLITRAGTKTSEFWFGMGAIVLILANGFEPITISDSHIMAIIALAGVYGTGRTVLKNNVAKAAKAGT